MEIGKSNNLANSMKLLLATLFVFSVLLPLVIECTHSPLNYEFSTALHAKYNLYWDKPIDGIICMAVEVETLGWVGLGFSPNGGMVDSDIMMAWVVDGEVTITDRYAVSQSLPVTDEQQDLELIEGYEEGGKTVIRFCREVETCDDRDRDLLSGTTKVVFSWNNNDPNPTPIQHITRGSKSVNIVGANTKFSPSVTSNATIMEFTMGNVSIPPQASLYWCKTFRFTQPAEKKHVIRKSVVLDPRNTQYIYHILINVCPATFPEMNGNCHDLSDPIRLTMAYESCIIAFSGWALGATDVEFPLDVGMPIGGTETFDTLLMEIHYINPDLVTGIVDDSGVRWYVGEVRMHDLAILNIGHIVNNHLLIPPKTKSFLVPGICPSNCTALFPHDIHIIGSFLHSRSSGVSLWTQLIRDGKEIALLDVNLNYDHNYQEYLAQQDGPITVKPGDELIFNCEFNTESRDEFTEGGPFIDNEACINFLFYYPKIPTAFCLSTSKSESSFNAALDSFQCNNVDVNGSTTTEELKARAGNIEWTDKISRTLEISQILDPNGHTAYCGFPLNIFEVQIPKPGVDYEVFSNRYDTCGKYNGSYYPGGSTADYYYNCTTNEPYYDPIGPTDSALTLLPTMWLFAALTLYLF